jgi:hypothetical protein
MLNMTLIYINPGFDGHSPSSDLKPPTGFPVKRFSPEFHIWVLVPFTG